MTVPDFAPAHPHVNATHHSEPKSGSSWKRGMQKIFKSKSSMALREAFSHVDPNRPAMPDVSNLPRPPLRPNNKPFASSTPPMPSQPQRKESAGYWRPWASTLSPTSATPSPALSSIGLPSQPDLPADPFSSIYDSYSNTLPPSPIISSPSLPPKRRLSRNSPSLRDLRNFISPSRPAKPPMAKAKSLANIRERTSKSEEPVASPPSTNIRLPRRISSAMFLSQKMKQPPISEEKESPTSSQDSTGGALPQPSMVPIPIESPPLLPPNPPYFPLGFRSASTPSSPMQHGLTIDTTPLSSSAPNKALPAIPSSTTSPLTDSPMTRSASGAVLLPRSRSTSMSLKSPPTSSSFFDLYEQLGIWPTSDKTTPEKSPEASTTLLAPAHETIPLKSSGSTNMISASPSAAFSMGSWNDALLSFPMVEGGERKSLDFGTLAVAEQEMPAESSFDAAAGLGEDEADTTFSSRIAVGGSNCSGDGSSQNTSSTKGYHTAAAGSSSGRSGDSGAYRGGSSSMRRGSSGMGGSDSNGGSSPGSRGDRKMKEVWAEGYDHDSESGSENEDDDVPLSQLHPEALAARRANEERKAAKKAAKIRARGRNPGGDVKWDGEGGVPADVLTRKLEALLLGHTRGSSVSAWSPLHVSTQKRSNAAASAGNTSARSPQAASQSTVLSPVSGFAGFTAIDALPPSLNSTASRPVIDENASLPRPPHIPLPPVPNPTRSNTTKTATTTRSTSSRNRSRAQSVSTRSHKGDDAKSPTAESSVPPRGDPATMVRANAFVGSMSGQRILLEIYKETTAKDILDGAKARGELTKPAEVNLDWVVVEIFAERGIGERLVLLKGCVLISERQVREYERLQDVMKGWDQNGGFNCFLLRQSNMAPPTWTRVSLGVSTTYAPTDPSPSPPHHHSSAHMSNTRRSAGNGPSGFSRPAVDKSSCRRMTRTRRKCRSTLSSTTRTRCSGRMMRLNPSFS